MHDLADYWDQTKAAEFEVNLQSEVTYYAIDNELSTKIQAIAQRLGISAGTLLNLWLQEKLRKQKI